MAAAFAEEFRWPVFVDGYQWIMARDVHRDQPDPAPMLAPADLSRDPELLPAHWYAPLTERPALFRTFADTVLTEQGILQFASRHGMLHPPGVQDETDYPIPPGRSSSLDGERISAEPFTEWMVSVLVMREAIALWDMLAAGDRAGLAEVIRWEDDRTLYCPRPSWFLPDWRGRRSENLPDAARWVRDLGFGSYADAVLLPKGQEGDVVGAATVALEMLVSRQLRTGVELRLATNRRTGRPALRPFPKSLAGTLWVQFAEAISGGKRYRVCKQCGEWFEIPLRGARISREYCSSGCRSKAYRERQERARQLHAEGKPLKEIAREFDTSVKIVRGWVATKQKEN
jgi:hypothetical protein